MVKSCQTNFPFPLPDSILEFDYGIQDPASSPAFVMSFYIRNQPLAFNPNTCTSSSILLTRKLTVAPLSVNIINIGIQPPNLPMQFTVLNQAIANLNTIFPASTPLSWTLVVLYLSRAKNRLLLYSDQGLFHEFLFPIPLAPAPFLNTANPTTMQITFNGGLANNCCYDIRGLRIGDWRFFGPTAGGEAVNLEDVAFTQDYASIHGLDFVFRNKVIDSFFFRDEQNSQINKFVVKTNKGTDSIWWMKGILEPDNLTVYFGDTFDDQLIIEYPKLKYATHDDGLVMSKTWTVEL